MKDNDIKALEAFKKELDERDKQNEKIAQEIIKKYPYLKKEDIDWGKIDSFKELGYLPTKNPNDYLTEIEAEVVGVKGYVESIYVNTTPFSMIVIGGINPPQQYAGRSSGLEILVNCKEPMKKLFLME